MNYLFIYLNTVPLTYFLNYFIIYIYYEYYLFHIHYTLTVDYANSEMSKETRNRLHFKIDINTQNSNTFRKRKKGIQVKLLFIIFVYSVYSV